MSLQLEQGQKAIIPKPTQPPKSESIDEYVKGLEIKRKEENKARYESLCKKHGIRDWDLIKRKEQEEKKGNQEKREKQQKEWWEQNGARIEREREERQKQRNWDRAQINSRHRQAAGKPIPGMWRVNSRSDGW